MTNLSSKLINRLKYLWFVVVMKVTWVLPDWQPIMRLRGFLTKPCFQASGCNLQFACDVTINSPENIFFGSDVYIAKGCWLHAIGGITIHDEVMLAPYVVVVTGNHMQKNDSYRFGETQRAPVSIGFGTWLGAGVKVMPGVAIGESSCCASGSVVNKDVPKSSIVGGVPARRLSITQP